jgi:cardiolipin synthase
MIDWSLLYLISEWVIRLAMLVYVPQRRSAAASRTWLLFIFLLPWPGIVLFALFGRIYLPARRVAMQERASAFIRQVQARVDALVAVEPNLPPNLEALPEEARRLGDFEVFAGNVVELLPEYDSMIERLIADIDAARHHAHLSFYIWEADRTGRRVADSLARAISRGVKCRVLMDALGSKRGLQHLAPEMRARGIEVIALLPFGPFRRNAARFDLRNHRKLAVIDGRIGYTGSQNIVDPGFVKGYPNEELMVRLTGPVVAQLQSVFLADRYFETGKVPDEQDLFPPLVSVGNSPTQLVPSGPGYRSENGRDLIISMLYAARQSVIITTPYFVPDEPFLQAIRAARQHGGVEVHLVLSLHANQHITQLAQQSYYEDLLEAGVEIHLYRQRFLHAKHLTIDDDIALIGSTNMDIRSFALNAEINLLIYDSAIVRELRVVQQRYFADSLNLKPADWIKRPLPAKVVQNTARLMDSFL